MNILKEMEACKLERDWNREESERLKDTLSEIIPALELASKCNADALRATCPNVTLTPNEWAALWMVKAIIDCHKQNET